MEIRFIIDDFECVAKCDIDDLDREMMKEHHNGEASNEMFMQLLTSAERLAFKYIDSKYKNGGVEESED